MSRKSRRFRRALMLLNLLASGYNVAVVWAMQLVAHPLGSHLAFAIPLALIGTGLAFAILKWPPPRAPQIAIQLGIGLAAAGWAAMIAGLPGLQAVVVTLYAVVALRLATRTFLAGEPIAEH